jgi:predicted nuclease of predicted toxin-antitoxin system
LKLLFDQNLPHRFARQFADIFSDSKHVKDAGLAAASDRQVWEYARSNGFAIISKDADFHQMSFLYGAPPKTIWLRKGNCSVNELEEIIRRHAMEIVAFLKDSENALLVVE